MIDKILCDRCQEEYPTRYDEYHHPADKFLINRKIEKCLAFCNLCYKISLIFKKDLNDWSEITKDKYLTYQVLK